MKASKSINAIKVTSNQSNFFSIFAGRNESPCKKVNKAKLNKESISKEYRTYSPKIRQMAISNKLLNEQLYSLYKVTKILVAGALLKSSILDGTIKVNSVVYIVSWLDTLPIEAYKEDTLCISLRTPKYKDSRTGEYPHSYAVVSKYGEE